MRMQFITSSQFGFDSALGEISCLGNPDQYYRRMWCAMQFDSLVASETNMDTSSSPDNLDSRKRPLENETENGVIKKSHYAADSEAGTYHFKLLVPGVAAGAIIGKGGETIAQLQREKHAKVKMSKSNDFYPGTTERVCIISSNSPESIMDVLTFIMEKIREKPDVTKPVVEPIMTEREKQVKILVPNTTAGMIIGKGGSYIKQIKEQTGAYIQLSQKPKDVSLPERCITVSGDIETNVKVCQMILQKIVEDPQSGSCLNLSYADVTGPVANFNPTGSPYATKSGGGPTPGGGGGGGGGAVGGSANASGCANENVINGGLNLCLNMPSVNSNFDSALTTKLLENVNLILRSAGFSEQSTAEIAAALAILAKYGMLGMGYGLPGNNSNKTMNSMLSGNAAAAAAAALDISALNGAIQGGGINLFGPVGSAIASRSAFDLTGAVPAAAAFDMFHPSQLTINNNCLTLAATATSPATDLLDINGAADYKKIDLEIPEEVVTNILGHGGRSLLELQYRTGAIIQISKKTLYSSAGGMNNRIVTLSGPSNGVAAAQLYIEHQISEIDLKRLRSNVNAIE
ncbi:RNA-binding protein Pasilla isoform X2 [Planococcus citri]|uniref:RNA-binding protein Pasilla isoform X2 n=1 Tax=Planococcus citri TaxID=170843 RepID=UPI0031F845A3